MRWWIRPDLRVMSVDNTLVQQMNVTALPVDVLFIEWVEQRGEIEYKSAPGLRAAFIDVTPYTSYFQQFLTLQKPAGLTLVQAKKVQTDLLALLYTTKRQVQIAFNVAAGNFSWDATDESVAGMSAIMVPALYSMITNTSTNSLVSSINNRLASLATNVNNNFGVTVSKLNAFISFMNNSIIGNISDGALANVINYALFLAGGSAPGSSPPGIQSEMPHSPLAVNDYTSVAVTPIAPGSIVPAGSTIPWTPIGQNAPVNLTMAEMSTLMNNLATRRQTLLNTRNTKTNAVNALTTIDAVIAYDVTAGW